MERLPIGKETPTIPQSKILIKYRALMTPLGVTMNHDIGILKSIPDHSVQHQVVHRSLILLILRKTYLLLLERSTTLFIQKHSLIIFTSGFVRSNC